MRETIFANHRFYHIYNRGVEKRKIFLDKEDYFRFIHDLFEFNDVNPAPPFVNRLKRGGDIKTIGGPTSNSFSGSKKGPIPAPRAPRKLLIKIHTFCLMPNHFHLILEQLVENGIKIFIHKLSTGYAYYFNLKYDRVGPLFQGRYKAIQIEDENYLLHLSRYQHINPVELIEPKWKEDGIKDWEKVDKFLENYRWSSYLDYIGKKNFPSVTNRELINFYFKTPEEYKKFISDWLAEDLEGVEDLILGK